MGDKKRAILVEDARLALLAGVVLTRRDWVKMSHEERIAWVAARQILTAPATTSASPEPELVREPARPKAPPRADHIRKVLEQGARECLGEEA